MQILKNTFKLLLAITASIYVSITLAGCSAGANGLISITPEQYLLSAKEQFETLEPREFEIRDLDEIIRILENAEKTAKKSETIDASRMYLCLLHTMKADKQYKEAIMKGEYVANRPEPFYTIDTKEVKETLREAKKWLRSCNSTFKTKSLEDDLNYVKGMYYTQKMLTQQSRERQESLDEAIISFRRCLWHIFCPLRQSEEGSRHGFLRFQDRCCHNNHPRNSVQKKESCVLVIMILSSCGMDRS